MLVHATNETSKMKKITSIERNPGPEEYYEIEDSSVNLDSRQREASVFDL